MGFELTEEFYRGIVPPNTPGKFSNWWKRDGTISDTAFKAERGVSVFRLANRNKAEVFAFIYKKLRLSKYVFSVTYKDIVEVAAFVEEDPPPPRNVEFHCNIYGDENRNVLSNKQARELARRAKLEDPMEDYPLSSVYFI